MFVLADGDLLLHTGDVTFDSIRHVGELFVLFLCFQNLPLVTFQLSFDSLDLLAL